MADTSVVLLVNMGCMTNPISKYLFNRLLSPVQDSLEESGNEQFGRIADGSQFALQVSAMQCSRDVTMLANCEKIIRCRIDNKPASTRAGLVTCKYRTVRLAASLNTQNDSG